MSLKWNSFRTTWFRKNEVIKRQTNTTALIRNVLDFACGLLEILVVIYFTGLNWIHHNVWPMCMLWALIWAMFGPCSLLSSVNWLWSMSIEHFET